MKHNITKIPFLSILKDIGTYFFCLYHNLLKTTTFTLENKTYRYFYHKYNSTWSNERSVEIPIIMTMMKDFNGKKILEVGNVLSHYFNIKHDILDKYEKAKWVINEDVVGFRWEEKYDLIVSISTLEHVGWDEDVRDPKKILCAIDNLKHHLTKDGKLIITLPVGYNTKLDKFLINKKIKFHKIYYLKRISNDNKWKQTSRKDVYQSKYNKPFHAANGLIIGILDAGVS